jgi:hypothetical protein
MPAKNRTHVLTAYLKNSVTRSVDPLRVIDWRMAACLVGAISQDRSGAAVWIEETSVPPTRPQQGASPT